MNSYRISKYNPLYRKGGKYQRIEWTDYSDIGSVFDGKVFTEAEYCLIEQNYILCIANILQLSGVKSLYIEEFENYEETNWVNNQYISADELPDIFRDCLRNKCWCKLSNGDTFIHFGYDYYVYITVKLSPIEVETICSKFHLFCDEFDSPYRTDQCF